MTSLRAKYTAPSSASSTASSDSQCGPSQPPTPSVSDQEDLESRVSDVLRVLPTLGFDSVESFICSYYTASFSGKTVIKAAQEASRIKGLPLILGELQAKAGSWSAWESSGYRDAIIRTAAQLLTDEFERLTKKKYSCEEEMQHYLSSSAQSSIDGRPMISHLCSTAGELKRTLQDEVRPFNLIASFETDN